MNILFSCIGKRSYIAEFFRDSMGGEGLLVGTSNTRWTPGFSSCDECVIVPPIKSDEYLPAVLEVCRRYDIRGILSFFDPDVHRLASIHDEFLKIGVRPVLPRLHAATIGFDKLLTFRFLTENGFMTPLTTDSLADAEQWISSGVLRFPLIVKPRFGYGSANTFLARTPDQLRAFYQYDDGMIIQEFIEGEALNFDGLGDLSGRALSVVPWRKLLSRQGETERAVTIEDPELLAYGVRLIESVGVVGPVDSDIFRTPDGNLWTLELNIRFGGGYPVSHLAGADFPRKIIQLIGDGVVEADVGKYIRGVTMMKKLNIIPGPDQDIL